VSPATTPQPFAERLLAWFDVEGRHDLPWQHPRAAYRVWLAEVMLQQTQVTTVIPYFTRFVDRFPDFAALAAAPIDDVLALWAGLGYYARARNLHAAARAVVAEHGGVMPRSLDAVQALPGVGRSTAGAILAQAYGERHAILDGNVKRVLARHGAIAGWPGQPAVARELWALSERYLPTARLADYTQAIMDLGATLCSARAPACVRCPIAEDCAAYRSDRIAEFPASKPAKARPRRSCRVLLVEDAAGALLIERRPPAGIWGGLWCPPLCDDDDTPATVLAERYGLQAEPIATLPPLKHVFTHFELTLQPLRLRAKAADGVAEHADRRWLKLHDREGHGLPAPIAIILNRLQEDPAPCPEPYTASNSASKPTASTARRSPANSASASTTKSRSRPGPNGSRTKRG